MSEAYLRLQGMCRADQESGCWVWIGGFTGKTKSTPLYHFPGSRADRRCMAAYKAAWLFAGKPIPAGHWVYRKCLRFSCVNPDHCSTGTPKEIGAYIASRGTRAGLPHRAAANIQNSLRQATPADLVRRIELMHAEGVMRKDISASLGISRDVVTAVTNGRHVHCGRLVRGASVFSQ